MDIKELTPPPFPLDLVAAQQWLREFQRTNPNQGQDLDGWRKVLEQTRPGGMESASLTEYMLNWIQENSLAQAQGQGWVLSMRGVATILANNGERKTHDQAWGHVSELISCCEWINSAPVENAPMEIADVLLFGSADNPGKNSVGDLDCIVLFKSKRDGAYSIAEKALCQLGMEEVLRPQGSSLPSFRAAARQWIGKLVPFASLDDQMRTVEVLLDQDENFACYSLLGKDWTYEQLTLTSADEDAGLVLRALERGRQSANNDYVQKRIELAREKSPDPRGLIEGLATTTGTLDKRINWWKQLDKPGLGMRRSVIKSEAQNTDIGRKPTPWT